MSKMLFKKPGMITWSTVPFVRTTINLMGIMFLDTGEYTGAGIFCKNQHLIKI
jgi:hypothetical protein